MADYIQNMTRDLKIYFDAIKEDYMNSKDKDFFRFTGTQIYCGRQGMGKTISAVRDVLRLLKRFPKAKLVTNVQLTIDRNEYPNEIIIFTEMDQLAELLTTVNNGKLGVIYLIDEIQTYFNALDSKNIPIYVFTEISQQRKQRKLIIGTSQLFLRLAKPFREQCSNLIMCKTYLGIITTCKAYDGEDISIDDDGNIISTKKRGRMFFQSMKLRNSYDTFQKVVSGSVDGIMVDRNNPSKRKK